MRANDRLLTSGLALALAAALLPAATGAAELVPGRPGRYELSSITIDATSGDCKATYETPAAGNLWMRGVDADVRVVVNPAWVHVTCRFTDMSALIEGNAEVGHTDACTLVTETTTYSDGWGIATSAANISERAEGGTSVAMCRFRVESAPAVERPPAHASRQAGPTTVSVADIEPSRSAGTRRSSVAGHADGTRAADRSMGRPDPASEAHGPANDRARSSGNTGVVTKTRDKVKRGPHTGKPRRER